MKHPYEKELTPINYSDKGYAIAYDSDGKTYFLLNALVDEKVNAIIYKHKKGIRYGKALTIINSNNNRTAPKDEAFNETSPWQIFKFDYENDVKSNYLKNLILQAYDFKEDVQIVHNQIEYEYRNKMEFGFYRFDDGKISLAFHQRDTKRGKVAVSGSSLIPQEIQPALDNLIKIINVNFKEPRNLKGLLVRWSFLESKMIFCLYVKDKLVDVDFINAINLFCKKFNIKGFKIFFSNPKSPANVETELIYLFGDTDLEEKIGKFTFVYPSHSFFQVNPSVFYEVIKDLNCLIQEIPEHKILEAAEYYAGVGTIGIMIANNVKHVYAIESTSDSTTYAIKNADRNGINNFELIEAKSEDMLDKLSQFDLVIVDPPRSGLHPKFVDALKKNPPKYLVYLSCNPKNLIRDLKEIRKLYTLQFFKGYNFYPKTPHVEALAFLKRCAD